MPVIKSVLKKLLQKNSKELNKDAHHVSTVTSTVSNIEIPKYHI